MIVEHLRILLYCREMMRKSRSVGGYEGAREEETVHIYAFKYINNHHEQ